MREVIRTDVLQNRFIVTIKGYIVPAEIGEEVQDDLGNRFVLAGFAMDGGGKDASLVLTPLNKKKEIGKYLTRIGSSA